jgi:hypothetical protein
LKLTLVDAKFLCNLLDSFKHEKKRTGSMEGIKKVPIQVAALYKAWVYGRSPAGIAGSNPARASMFASCDCHVLSGRGIYFGLITRLEKSY